MARPTLLDESVTQAVCDALRRGVSRQAASVLGGIGWETFKRWRRLAFTGSELHVAFWAAVQKAEAEVEGLFVDRIAAGAQGWQSAAWWLERRRRQTYRRPVQPTAEQEDLSKLSDEEIDRELREYAERRKLRVAK